MLGLTYFLVDRSADAVNTLLTAAKLDPKEETAARYVGDVTLPDSADPNPAAVTELCRFADANPKNKTATAFCGGALLREAKGDADTTRLPEILHRLADASRAGGAKDGTNRRGKVLHYYFNYSNDSQHFTYSHGTGSDLLSQASVAAGQSVTLQPWDVAIVEEQ